MNFNFKVKIFAADSVESGTILFVFVSNENFVTVFGKKIKFFFKDCTREKVNL